MKSFLALIVGFIVLTKLGGAADATRATPKFTSLTVFGDSLVDAGNYFTLTNDGFPDAASGYPPTPAHPHVLTILPACRIDAPDGLTAS